MILLPQDVLFLLKLISVGKNTWSYHALAVELGMSPSEVYASSKRVIKARLAAKQENLIKPIFRNLEEFLLHGIQYVFVPERSGINRGIPTAL